MSVIDIPPILMQIVIVAILPEEKIKNMLQTTDNGPNKQEGLAYEEYLKLLYISCCKSNRFKEIVSLELDTKSKNITELISVLPNHCVEKHFFQYVKFDKAFAGLFLWALIRNCHDKYKCLVGRFSIVLADSLQCKKAFGV